LFLSVVKGPLGLAGLAMKPDVLSGHVSAVGPALNRRLSTPSRFCPPQIAHRFVS
jgi:hypothetical protein